MTVFIWLMASDSKYQQILAWKIQWIMSYSIFSSQYNDSYNFAPQLFWYNFNKLAKPIMARNTRVTEVYIKLIQTSYIYASYKSL